MKESGENHRFGEFSLVFYQLDETCVEIFGSICSPAKQLWLFLYRLFKKLRLEFIRLRHVFSGSAVIGPDDLRNLISDKLVVVGL